MSSNNYPTKVLDVCQVSPLPESAIELSLPLTFFDIFWLKFHPVTRIHYHEVIELTPAMFHTEILPKLKHSLSLTLFHFLPLAGNLTWPSHAAEPIILYTPEDGVSLKVVESSDTADFDCLSSNEMHDAFISHPYVPQLSTSDTKVSILALQITLFPNKGFSIGYTFNHAALDGKSIVMFMKAWAHICKHSTGLLPVELKPFFDRSVVQDSEGLDMEYLNRWFSINARSLTPISTIPEAPPSSVRATFAFSLADMKRLRETVLSQFDEFSSEKDNKPVHLSSFVLSCSYTLVCIVKARGLRGDEKILFRCSADCRARLDPPLPTNYFGNCIRACSVLLDVESLREDNGIAFAAQKLSEMVKGLEKGALAGAKGKVAGMTVEQGVIPVGVAGSPRFEIYGVDFQWGRPKNVEVTTIDRTGSISMAESKDGCGGVEIGVVLKKHEMEIFERLFNNGLTDA